MGSVNTIRSYVDYLENSWLFFVINKYAYSVKEQQIAAKKIYNIDTGLVRSVGFSFSDNEGKLMENAVFLQLKRKHQDIYYYKTDRNYEVDFFLPKERSLIQVSKHFAVHDLDNRETRALLAAAKEQRGPSELQVITQRDKFEIDREGSKIKVTPLYEWLLKS